MNDLRSSGTALLSIPSETLRVSKMKGVRVQEKKSGLFDQIFFESENLKFSRRKVGEAMRKVRIWFNKEFTQSEPLPPEFKNLNIQTECERTRDLWRNHF